MPNGKVHRRCLRDQPLTDEVKKPEMLHGDEVLSTREQMLTSLWAGLLGRSSIDLDDNFFELGAHSLLVARATLAIERDFEVSLRATDVFENPTVRQLAERLEVSEEKSARSIKAVLSPLIWASRATPLPAEND